MEVIDRIMHLASQKKITANKLAVECKLNSSAMTEWRKGKKSPGIDALIKIANYFNVSLDYLVGRADPSSEPSIFPDTFIKDWQRSNQTVRDMTCNYIKDLNALSDQEEAKERKVGNK